MERLFNGDKLFLFPPSTKEKYQNMAYVAFVSGRIVVIDGGGRGDYPLLQEFLIEKCKCEVDLWIFTHAHPDHIGAASEIMNKGIVKIKKMCFDFPKEIDFKVARVNGDVLNMLYEGIGKNEIEVVRPTLGEMEIEGVKLCFLKLGNTDSSDFNNTSTVFKMYTNGEPILILGDIHDPECERLMRNKADEIRCNVCQMAHHGQNHVGIEFYRTIGVKYALFNTPIWLWNNDLGKGFNTGPFWTINTREQMRELGAVCITAFDEITEID